MYAIVEIRGKQFKVMANEEIVIPKLKEDVGQKVEFDKVLFISNSEDDMRVGKPTVNAKVLATVLSHGKDEKVLIFKKKRRKGYQKKTGHRQQFTEIRIDEIKL